MQYRIEGEKGSIYTRTVQQHKVWDVYDQLAPILRGSFKIFYPNRFSKSFQIVD